MNQKEIKELIELLVEKDIAEFALERGDMKLHIKRGGAAQASHVVQMAPAAVPVQVVPTMAAATSAPAEVSSAGGTAASATAGAAPQASGEADLFILKSPIVGTYYEAPSPGTPPFVKVGDKVQEGQVLCIIEAMKLMNEIEAEVSGEIAKLYVPNGSPVEYGMPLFGIRKH